MRNTDTTIRRKRPHGMRIIYIALSLYCLYNISLFVLLFIGSLKGKAEIFSSSIWALPEAAVWQNYVDAWNIGKIGTYTLNSIYVTGMTMLLTIILASMAAYVLGRIPFRASNLIMTAIMIGMMLPALRNCDPAVRYSQAVKASEQSERFDSGLCRKAAPFSTYVLTSFYKGLPYTLEEAAIIDGASPLTTFVRIMLPLTGSAMISVTINNMLNVWNEFLLALIFLSDKKIYTLPIGLFYLSQNAEYSSSWTILFAGMIISVIPVLIVFALFQKQFAQGVSQGAVKG